MFDCCKNPEKKSFFSLSFATSLRISQLWIAKYQLNGSSFFQRIYCVFIFFFYSSTLQHIRMHEFRKNSKKMDAEKREHRWHGTLGCNLFVYVYPLLTCLHFRIHTNSIKHKIDLFNHSIELWQTVQCNRNWLIRSLACVIDTRWWVDRVDVFMRITIFPSIEMTHS